MSKEWTSCSEGHLLKVFDEHLHIGRTLLEEAIKKRIQQIVCVAWVLTGAAHEAPFHPELQKQHTK